MITIAVALGTSTPTSMTVVATSTLISPAAKSRITWSFSSGCSLPCRMPSRSPASGPAASVPATSSTDSGWRRRAHHAARDAAGHVHVAEVVLGGVRAQVVRVFVVRARARVADPRADHVGLPPLADLLPDPLPGPLQEVRLVRRGHHVGGDGRAPGGQLGQRGGLQVAVHGHGDRPRDRGGRHDQDVRPVARGLGAQRVALFHAEPVLLVDHHQAQVGELDLVLEQGVGADHDAGVAGEHVGQRRAPGGRPGRAGEQGHAGRVLGRAELARRRPAGRACR